MKLRWRRNGWAVIWMSSLSMVNEGLYVKWVDEVRGGVGGGSR